MRKTGDVVKGLNQNEKPIDINEGKSRTVNIYKEKEVLIFNVSGAARRFQLKGLKELTNGIKAEQDSKVTFNQQQHNSLWREIQELDTLHLIFYGLGDFNQDDISTIFDFLKVQFSLKSIRAVEFDCLRYQRKQSPVENSPKISDELVRILFKCLNELEGRIEIRKIELRDMVKAMTSSQIVELTSSLLLLNLKGLKLHCCFREEHWRALESAEQFNQRMRKFKGNLLHNDASLQEELQHRQDDRDRLRVLERDQELIFSTCHPVQNNTFEMKCTTTITTSNSKGGLIKSGSAPTLDLTSEERVEYYKQPDVERSQTPPLRPSRFS